jgi:NitT/TauT family transport system ATP-binding protein
MFQQDNLLPWLNILDNVLIGLKIQKKITDEKIKEAKKIDQIFKSFKLHRNEIARGCWCSEVEEK